MASKEQSVEAECALQLRTLGDLIYWKYMLLEFLARTLQAANKIQQEGRKS
ncbi:LOW QUALITY PROTEIN: phorbol-12-myristate-13-acetate-induced protein 1 [Pangasianodon hypophthalmus]|uniref:LOW QUALITY PROTEIN: phorbol-12-myristate-13-acetate-induced protein 1 n=1 Tax=Pangasianodon hypophthalmus TaxID=310915 RepID=UPI00147B24E7|nr:LOW QUALITY PROTEIN: phorbol-12-myristate-13-acetate-induced protein 1 [Pangasianodon hypophthalmus]